MGGTQSPPSFTEFSGFVLSALAMENLCLCMCGGVPVSHLLLHPCTPQCLPCSGGAGFCCSPVPQHCQKSVCASGWGASPYPPGVCAMSCLWGCHFSIGGLGERWGSFLSLVDKCGIHQPELWEAMLSLSCSGTKVKIKAHLCAVMRGPLPLPSQSREAAFQTQPQTSFTLVGRWSRGVKGGWG